MKRTYLRFSLTISIYLSTLTANAQEVKERVDFNTINSIIEEVVARSVQFDNMIQQVGLKISPQSKIQFGDFDAQFSAKVGETPWILNQSSNINLLIGTRFRDVTPWMKEGVLRLKGEVITPIFKLAHFYAEHLLKNFDPSTNSEVVIILKQLASANDMNDLFEVAIAFKDHAIKKSKDVTTTAFINGLKIEKYLVNGKTDKIKIIGTKPYVISFNNKIELQLYKISISENKFSLDIRLTSNFKTEDFIKFTSELEQQLVKIQNQDPLEISEVSRAIRNYCEIAKGLLK